MPDPRGAPPSSDDLLRRAPDRPSISDRGVPPPSPLYVTRDDFLHVAAHAWNAAVSVSLEARLLAPNGEVLPMVTVASLAADGTEQTMTLRLSEGWLLQCGARWSGTGTAPAPGQCQLQLSLGRGPLTSPSMLIPLAGGILFRGGPLGWPSPYRRPQEPWATNRFVSVVNPAAGAEWSNTFGGSNIRYNVRAVAITLVTDATVAARRVELVVDDGTNIIHRVPAQADQTASLTNHYMYAPHGAYSAPFQLVHQLPMPHGLELEGSYRVRTITANLQAGDDYTGVVTYEQRVYVEA